MKPRLLLWCVPFGIVVLFATGAPTRALAYPRPAAGSTLTADKGKFRILQQGNEAGTEEFDLEPAGNGWVMQGQTVIRVPGSPEMRTSGELRISADGTPQHYTWSAYCRTITTLAAGTSRRTRWNFASK